MQPTVNPPTTNAPKPKQKRSMRQFLGTRQGMLAMAFTVAIVGGAAVLAFLQQYRDSLDEDHRPVTVLVAKELIGKGTAGDVVATEALFQASELPQSEAKNGAITDPGSLRGRVAAKDVFPGEQLTTEAFVAGGSSVESRLTGLDRAIAVPVDGAHGLLGNLRAGDRVDVLAALVVQRSGAQPRPVVRTLAQDVLVLDVPNKPPSDRATGGSADKGQVVLRVNDRTALAVAFASDTGEIWLVARPPSHAEQSRPAIQTPETIVTGQPPVPLRGGRR
jgi:Flp pilus assembly protein CpaB